MGIFNFSIPQEEKTLLVAKVYWMSYLTAWVKILITGLILGFVLTFCWPFWWENRWGRTGIIIFSSAAIIYVLIDFWKKILTTYIITRGRLIDITQEKIFRRVITEVGVDEVDKVVVKQRFWWDRVLGRGNVIIKLKSQKGVLVFYDVKNPETIKTILEDVEKETLEILDKKGEECGVILKDDKTHKIPLNYSYYGKKANLNQARPKKGKNGLMVVKKKQLAIDDR